MDLVADLHTHTIASGHAYSTLLENITAAAKNGIKLLGITDHAPNMYGCTTNSYFSNFSAIDHCLDGIEIKMGAELNIIDYNGTVDLPDNLIMKLDFSIASLHPPCIAFGTKEQNTSALIGAMENPYIHIIGHPGDPRYPIDTKEVVKASARTKTLLEINNASLIPGGFRDGSDKVMEEILFICNKKDIPIIVASDAHFCTRIGHFEYALALLEKVGFPQELVLNTSIEGLKNYLG